MLPAGGRMRGSHFRRAQKFKISVASDSVAGNVAEELADVFIYVCSLANMHGIDLERAFREKEEKNKRRTWKKI